jgi:hypothetical protein
LIILLIHKIDAYIIMQYLSWSHLYMQIW